METTPAKILLVFGLLYTPLMTDGAFDYFQFVQLWPRTFCDNSPPRPCVIMPSYFTEHGLWGSKFTSTKTSCLRPRETYAKATGQEFKRRYKCWPDLTEELTKKNQFFWSHEWSTHGGCSENLYNQIDYFEIACKLKGKYDLLKILELKNIISGKNVNVESVGSAVKENTGKEPQVKRLGGNKPQLHEIIICLTPNVTNAIDCPRTKHLSCYANPKYTGWVLFPEAPILSC